MAIRGESIHQSLHPDRGQYSQTTGFSSEYVLRGQTKCEEYQHMVAALNCQSTSKACRRRMQKSVISGQLTIMSVAQHSLDSVCTHSGVQKTNTAHPYTRRNDRHSILSLVSL